MEVLWCGLALPVQAALALSPRGWPAHPDFYGDHRRLAPTNCSSHRLNSSTANSLAVTDASFSKAWFFYHFSSAVCSPFTWGTNKRAKRNPNTICINLLAGSQFLLNIATVYFGFNRTFLKLKASREVSGFWTKHFLPP